MDQPLELTETEHRPVHRKWPAVLACLFALVGLGDSIYLTVQHYTAAPVPCSIIEGCETVLTSSWATIGEIPLAAFGAVSYFVAFSLAVLTAFGDRRMWLLFGVLTAGMAAFSAFLIYLQAFVIGAFCQFCLISAASSILLFVMFWLERKSSN